MKYLGVKEEGGIASSGDAYTKAECDTKFVKMGTIVQVPCSDLSIDNVRGTYQSSIQSAFFDNGEPYIRAEMNFFVNLSTAIPASPNSYFAGNLKYKGNNMSPVYGCWGGVYSPGAMSFAINPGGTVYFYSHYDVAVGKLICFTATLYFTRQHLVDIGLLS